MTNFHQAYKVLSFSFIHNSPAYLRDFLSNGKMGSKTKWEVNRDAWCIK